MRKQQKDMALEFLQTLRQAHIQIRTLMIKEDNAQVMDLLEQCQQGAIQLGNFIESEEGECSVTIKMLEKYCESVYRFHEKILQFSSQNLGKIYNELHKDLILIENSVRNDIIVRTEAVFLPYKASMWDSLESIWKAAEDDPNCDAYVIPIPYYDKNQDGTFCDEHYEGDHYPEYVPITRYDRYNFEERQPDMIFIHNPYDGGNYVTSTHPFFYSRNLKKYTENLIYVPYFILEEISPDNLHAVDGIKHFCMVPGVLHADNVIVQSEDMRQIYINVMTEHTGEKTRDYWKKKIWGTGSPKEDKVFNIEKDDMKLPEEWVKIIKKSDGCSKKIVFYNTGIVALLKHGHKMLEKIREVFRVFKENQGEVSLLWRPHPLLEATINAVKPQLWKEYNEILQQYKDEGWGIYDDTADLNRAIEISDWYLGDKSSVVQLFQKKGKIVLIQNVEIKEKYYATDIDYYSGI